MLKMTTSLLPHGTYRSRVLRRRSIAETTVSEESGGMFVELTVVILDGPHATRQLPFKVFGEARTRRARLLQQGEAIWIHVVTSSGVDGRPFNRVVDFVPAGQASAVDIQHAMRSPKAALATIRPDQTAVPGLRPEAELLGRLRAAVDGGCDADAANVGVGVEQDPMAAASSQHEHAEAFLLGFWASRKRNTREIVDHDVMFHGLAAVNVGTPMPGEGYLSLYQYSTELAAHRDRSSKKSLKGYRGQTWARWLAIDLDGNGSVNDLGRILDDARKSVTVLTALGVPRSHVLVFFSGSRGVHVLFPATAFAAAPMVGFEKAAGATCGVIAALANVTIDESLYTPLKPLRAHNTQHDETGLYKVLIGQDELESMTCEALLRLARQPRPFAVPDWRVPPSRLLVELWEHACRAAEAPRQPIALPVWTSNMPGERWIFADTLDLIIHGAPEGSRGSRFFRAAMNLLDFNCPEELLAALLKPAARLSNYPDHEFTAQINGAIKAHTLSQSNTTS
jgi:hypothetical protein